MKKLLVAFMIMLFTLSGCIKIDNNIEYNIKELNIEFRTEIEFNEEGTLLLKFGLGDILVSQVEDLLGDKFKIAIDDNKIIIERSFDSEFELMETIKEFSENAKDNPLGFILFSTVINYDETVTYLADYVTNIIASTGIIPEKYIKNIESVLINKSDVLYFDDVLKDMVNGSLVKSVDSANIIYNVENNDQELIYNFSFDISGDIKDKKIDKFKKEYSEFDVKISDNKYTLKGKISNSDPYKLKQEIYESTGILIDKFNCRVSSNNYFMTKGVCKIDEPKYNLILGSSDVNSKNIDDMFYSDDLKINDTKINDDIKENFMVYTWLTKFLFTVLLASIGYMLFKILFKFKNYVNSNQSTNNLIFSGISLIILTNTAFQIGFKDYTLGITFLFSRLIKKLDFIDKLQYDFDIYNILKLVVVIMLISMFILNIVKKRFQMLNKTVNIVNLITTVITIVFIILVIKYSIMFKDIVMTKSYILILVLGILNLLSMSYAKIGLYFNKIVNKISVEEWYLYMFVLWIFSIVAYVKVNMNLILNFKLGLSVYVPFELAFNFLASKIVVGVIIAYTIFYSILCRKQIGSKRLLNILFASYVMLFTIIFIGASIFVNMYDFKYGIDVIFIPSEFTIIYLMIGLYLVIKKLIYKKRGIEVEGIKSIDNSLVEENQSADASRNSKTKMSNKTKELKTKDSLAEVNQSVDASKNSKTKRSNKTKELKTKDSLVVEKILEDSNNNLDVKKRTRKKS